MPAGTGVCVVKTVPARAADSASSNVRPCVCTSSRIRSRPRKPAWPSLVWNTSGSGAPVMRAYARSARTPPTPSRSSCWRRCSPPPPYRRSVTSRSARSFSSTSESSMSRGTRPTSAFQTCAWRVRPPGMPILIDHGRAVGLAQQRQRQAVGVEDGVLLLLPAVERERLTEVAGPVEQADADDRDAEVGRRLQVVAGEDAEAAGVLRQHLGDAELRREVRDRLRRVRRRATGTSGRRSGRSGDRRRPSPRGRRSPRRWRARPSARRGPRRAGGPGHGRPRPRGWGRCGRRGPGSPGSTTTAGWPRRRPAARGTRAGLCGR